MNICFKKLRDFTDPSGSHNKMNTIQCSVVKGQDSYNNQNVQLKIDLRNNCYDVILLIDCIVYSYVIFVLALLLYYGLLTHYNSVWWNQICTFQALSLEQSTSKRQSSHLQATISLGRRTSLIFNFIDTKHRRYYSPWIKINLIIYSKWRVALRLDSFACLTVAAFIHRDNCRRRCKL